MKLRGIYGRCRRCGKSLLARRHDQPAGNSFFCFPCLKKWKNLEHEQAEARLVFCEFEQKQRKKDQGA